MRSKLIVAALAGLFMAGTSVAQVAGDMPPPQDPQNILNLDLSTGGRVQIQLRPDKAPYSVERIKTLTRRHFYDGLIFHRVIEGFMAQGGDPQGTGEGGSDLPDLKAEFNDLPHVRGAMAMARAQSPDSANSQFYIMLQPNLTLDRNYTVIGRVVSGMQYVDAVERGEPPANPSKIVHASIQSDDQGQPPVAFVAPADKPAEAAPQLTGKAAKAAAKQARKEAEDKAEADAKAKKEQEKAARKAAKEQEKAAREESGRSASGTAAAVDAISPSPTATAVDQVATEEAPAQPN